MLSRNQIKSRKSFCEDVQAGLRRCWSHVTGKISDNEAQLVY